MMSIDNTYSEAEVRAFDERVRKALGGEQPAVRAGAEDRRHVDQPSLRGRQARPRRHARPRQRRRRHHRQRPHDQIDPADAAAATAKTAPPPILEVRGEVYMDNDDFQRVNKEIEADGRRALRQPAQPHDRHAPPPRPEDRRQAPAAIPRPRPRPGRADAGRELLGMDAAAPRSGACRCRKKSGAARDIDEAIKLHPRVREDPPQAAVHDRRHGR